MKLISTRSVYNGPVNGRTDVGFAINEGEREELLAALKIINKYEKESAKFAGVSPKYPPDWIMYKYAVKTDKVVVSVELGACG